MSETESPEHPTPPAEGGSASDSPDARDPTYYLQDEMLVFSVENRLFKVHRRFLEKYSSKFRSILESGSRKGKSNEDPIVLEDVTVKEFTSLLNFFYLGMFYRDILLEELTALLAISTRYDFKAIRSQVIEEISEEITSVAPVARISLDQQHKVGLWSHGAFVELCARSDPLEESEGQKLGLATTVKVLQARERYQKDRWQSNWGPSADSIINDIFQTKTQPATPAVAGKKKKGFKGKKK